MVVVAEEYCAAREDCPFYMNRFFYDERETQFYFQKCLKKGEGCGLKKNWDEFHESERFKDLEKKLNERSKKDVGENT